MNTKQSTRRCCALVFLLLFVAGCATSQNRRAGSTSTATNLPPFDLAVCYPLQRDFGDDTQLEGMWLAIRDSSPQLDECMSELFFRKGPSSGALTFEFVVQPDHSVAISHTTDTDDAKFRQCIDNTISKFKLPPSSDPSGQMFKGKWSFEQGGSASLRMGASTIGSIVGSIRNNTLNACDCFDAYKNAVPPSQKFKFNMIAGKQEPQQVAPSKTPQDPKLAHCLGNYLRQLPIKDFGRTLQATYTFKFDNSRVVDLDELVKQASATQNRQQWTKAIELWRNILALEPEHTEALTSMGTIYIELNKFTTALSYYERAHTVEETGSTYYNLARAYNSLEKHGKAYDLIEQSIDEEPDSFWAYHLKGIIELSLEKPEAAYASGDQSLRLNPRLALAAVLKAKAAHKLGRSDEALKLLKHASTLDLKEPRIFSEMAWLYFELEAWEQALGVYEMAEERGFKSANQLYNKGVALQRLKQTSRAKIAFCNAAKLDPNHKLAPKACNR